jgi:hypothetical protein
MLLPLISVVFFLSSFIYLFLPSIPSFLSYFLNSFRPLFIYASPFFPSIMSFFVFYYFLPSYLPFPYFFFLPTFICSFLFPFFLSYVVPVILSSAIIFSILYYLCMQVYILSVTSKSRYRNIVLANQTSRLAYRCFGIDT